MVPVLDQSKWVKMLTIRRLTLVDDRLDILPHMVVDMLASKTGDAFPGMLSLNSLNVVSELGFLIIQTALNLFSVIVLEDLVLDR
jgi:hypothetical protein